MKAPEGLQIPARNTVVTSIDIIKAFCDPNGLWAREQGTDEVADMVTVAAESSRMLQSLSTRCRLAIFQSLYRPYQFTDVTPKVSTMCTVADAPERTFAYNPSLDDHFEDTDIFPKDANSVFDYEPFIEMLATEFIHLCREEPTDDVFCTQWAEQRENPEETLYVLLSGVTNTCIGESVRDAFKRLLVQLRMPYRLLIPKNVIGSRISQRAKLQELFDTWGSPESRGTYVYEKWDEIQLA